MALVFPTVFIAGCGGGGESTSSPVSRATPTTQATTISTSTLTPQLRVACVGDSITAGVGTTNYITDAYPAVLGRALGQSYVVQNFGVGGTTALNIGRLPYQRQDAFTRAVTFKPDILVVELGTNDRAYTFTSRTKGDFQKDYETLIGAFKKSNSAVKVYTCLPTPSYPLDGGLNGTLSTDVLPLIRQVAQDTGANVIDLNTPLSGNAAWFPDGVHPTTKAAHLIAAQVYLGITGKVLK